LYTFAYDTAPRPISSNMRISCAGRAGKCITVHYAGNDSGAWMCCKSPASVRAWTGRVLPQSTPTRLTVMAPNVCWRLCLRTTADRLARRAVGIPSNRWCNCSSVLGDKIHLKNPGGGEIFRTRPDRPWGPPSLLYNGCRVFPGGKAAGAWCWPPTPF
jgi:hypothetical protein